MSTCHVSKRRPRRRFVALSHQGHLFVPINPQVKWDEVYEGSRLVHTEWALHIEEN